MNGSRQVSLAPLFGTAHIDDLDAVRASEFVQRHRFQLPYGLELATTVFPFVQNVATKDSAYSRQTNFAEIAEDVLHCLVTLDFGEQINVVVVVRQSAHPIQEGLTERNIQRARHVSGRKFLGGTAVDDASLSAQSIIERFVVEEFGRRCFEVGRPCPIEALHGGEVSRRDWLVLEHSGDELRFAQISECPVE